MPSNEHQYSLFCVLIVSINVEILTKYLKIGLHLLLHHEGSARQKTAYDKKKKKRIVYTQ